MPSFDFHCNGCGHDFEEWMPSARADAAPCPRCASLHTQKVYKGRWQCGAQKGGAGCNGNCAGCKGCNH